MDNFKQFFLGQISILELSHLGIQIDGNIINLFGLSIFK